jgi:hypothetical protein
LNISTAKAPKLAPADPPWPKKQQKELVKINQKYPQGIHIKKIFFLKPIYSVQRKSEAFVKI